MQEQVAQNLVFLQFFVSYDRTENMGEELNPDKSPSTQGFHELLG